MRNLVLVLGDQLDRRSAAFDGFDPRVDRVWMAEARHESTPLDSSKARIAMFLACMRHFRDALRDAGLTVEYHALDAVPRAAPGVAGALIALLQRDLDRLKPASVVLLEPGDHGLGEALRAALRTAGATVDEREDRHFLCSRAEFAAHARGRKQLRMEFLP